jgi:hypothetical protein
VLLDYVTGWYIKQQKYIQKRKLSGICFDKFYCSRGEQTRILWGQMINKYGVKIHFASNF